MSGMVSPYKVISFLRILPPWNDLDPSLAMIMVTGVLPNAFHYANMKRSEDGKIRPIFSWETWQVPTSRTIDWKLICGAAVFGIGWGLSGICPGPAIVSLGEVLVEGMKGRTVNKELSGWVAFALPMIGGMRLARVLA